MVHGEYTECELLISTNTILMLSVSLLHTFYIVRMLLLEIKNASIHITGSARPEVRGTAEPHGGAYPP